MSTRWTPRNLAQKILNFFVISGDKNSPKSQYFKYVYLLIFIIPLFGEISPVKKRLYNITTTTPDSDKNQSCDSTSHDF